LRYTPYVPNPDVHASEGAWINDLAGNALQIRMDIGSSGILDARRVADIRITFPYSLPNGRPEEGKSRRLEELKR
jgi:hypothetical protein